jgi:uncharacterized protein
VSASSIPARPASGERVTFRWRKWDGGDHWVHDCVYLGSDEWGDWLGQPRGWRSVRPGRDVVADRDNVTLVPPSGDHALTVNADAPGAVRVYIDIAWDVRWSETEHDVVEGIDMDLDVVLARDARGLWIDDRDEWEEHRVRYGYPLDLVARLESVAIDLERRVGAGEAPYDDATADRWLARLREIDPAAR